MHDHILHLIIKAVKEEKYNKAICLIEILAEEDEKRISNDKDHYSIRKQGLYSER